MPIKTQVSKPRSLIFLKWSCHLILLHVLEDFLCGAFSISINAGLITSHFRLFAKLIPDVVSQHFCAVCGGRQRRRDFRLDRGNYASGRDQSFWSVTKRNRFLLQ